MITCEEISEKWVKVAELYRNFLLHECANIHSHSAIIYFLDTHKLYVGISCGIDAEDWLCELSSVILEVKNSRLEAEQYTIAEALQILENELNKNI